MAVVCVVNPGLGHGECVRRRGAGALVPLDAGAGGLVATRLAVLAPARRRARPQAYRVLPPESEESFQRRVLELARWMGWSLRYHTFDSRKSAPGFPDLVLVRAPRVVFAECKTDYAPKELIGAQRLWMHELLRCPGIEYYVWRPRNWQEIERILARRPL